MNDPPTVVAVIGSRRRTDQATVVACIEALPAGTVIVSGGASGPDTFAAEAAQARGLEVRVFRPDLRGARSRGEINGRYLARNQLIVAAADRVVAFVAPDRRGGTEDAIRRANRAGKAGGDCRSTSRDCLVAAMKAAPPGENPVYPNRLGFVRITHADRPPIRWPARVVIYLNDHRPAHVHVIGAEGEAAFILHCPDGPPELRESYGFSRPDVGRIKDALAAVLATLCDEWRKLHGGD